MSTVVQVSREGKGRVGHAGVDLQVGNATPAAPTRFARKRRPVRDDHSVSDAQKRAVIPHNDPALPDSRIGHARAVTQLVDVDAAHIPDPGLAGREGDQYRDDAQQGLVALANNPSQDGGVGHTSCDAHVSDADPATITAIRHYWRKRQAWHRAERSLTLQAKALCRGLTDGDTGDADKLYAAAIGKGDHPDAVAALGFILPLIEARDSIEKHRTAVEKHLTKLAYSLPIAGWARAMRGVGPITLYGVIGEAGDLSNYANPAKLWKRMGLAPHQGRAYATWRSRGGLTAQDWTDAGYSPSRRSTIWQLGPSVIKAGGPLREVYDARKPMEMAKCEAIAADPELRKQFAKDGKYAPKLHAHNRASRYMEKRFLLLMWREWRRATLSVTSMEHVPDAT